MVICTFQCYSLKSSHPLFLPLSPKVCSLHLFLFWCPATSQYCKVIILQLKWIRFKNNKTKHMVKTITFICVAQIIPNMISESFSSHLPCPLTWSYISEHFCVPWLSKYQLVYLVSATSLTRGLVLLGAVEWPAGKEVGLDFFFLTDQNYSIENPQNKRFTGGVYCWLILLVLFLH